MKISNQIYNYTIRDIVNYRAVTWTESEDFYYVTDLHSQFEPFFVKPDYYCFGIITEGKMEITINAQHYELCMNSMVIYRPDQVFRISRLDEGTKGVFVLFNRKFLDNLNENIFSVKSNSFLSPGTQTVIKLRDTDKRKLTNTFNEIFCLLGSLSKTRWELIARNLTSALIYETDVVLEAYIDRRKINSNIHLDLYKRFNDLVCIYFANCRSLSFYASELFVSDETLRKIIKMVSGETAGVLISSKVMTKAKYLIGYTLKNFSEIAAELNFSDQFAFSKYFKKHYGHSPMYYRKHEDCIQKGYSDHL